MKKIIVLALLFTAITTFAQNKVAKGTLEVKGICMMCKARIEKACISSKGVKFADWNVNTHELKVIYDDRKTDLKIINQTLADAGHDTKMITATHEAYEKIHACCKYREEAVQDDHKDVKQEDHEHEHKTGHGQHH